MTASELLATVLGVMSIISLIAAVWLSHLIKKEKDIKKPEPFIIKEKVLNPISLRYSTEADVSQWKLEFLRQKAIEALCEELSKKPEYFDVVVSDSFISPAFKNIEVNLRILPSEPRTTKQQ